LETTNEDIMLKEYKSEEVDSINRKSYIMKEYRILEEG